MILEISFITIFGCWVKITPDINFNLNYYLYDEGVTLSIMKQNSLAMTKLKLDDNNIKNAENWGDLLIGAKSMP